MNLISEALAQTLQPVAPPFDWTGIIFAAIVIALVVYIIWIKRTPGLQIGESQLDRLTAALHSNTAATVAAAPQVDVQAAIAAALAADRAARTPAAPSLTIEQVRQLVPTAPTPVAAPLPVKINPNVPVEIEFGGQRVWLYQGVNFATQEEIVAWDAAVAARDANLANIDHSPLPLTPEQVAAALDPALGGADPALRASWKNPSATYQSAVRIRDGLTPDDVNRRINEANGAGNYGIWPKT